MKKRKFLSALLACSMSVVAASACAFTVGCKDDKDDGGDTAHVHQWATTWSHDENNHWHACTNPGHTGDHKDKAAHVWDNAQDTNCNVCGYVRTVSGGGTDPGTNPGTDPGTNPGTTPSTKTNVVVNASDLTVGALTDGAVLGTGVKAVGTPAVDGNKKTITYKGEAIEVTNRIKLSSRLSNQDTPMGIEVTAEDAATVIVYYYSGSNGQTRGLELYDAQKTLIADTTTALSDGSVMATAMFSVTANTTYYIGASVAGVNVYYLAVVYGDIGETWTPHEAKAAECGVAGNIAYSQSNYGRYKNSSDVYIMGNAYSIAALQHSYTLKTDSITNPTEAAEGSATLTCANGHETPVELPVLSSDKYTARPAAGVTGTYTITINGVSISFKATGVAEKETTYTDVYALADFTDVTVGSSKTAGQNCVYTDGPAATIDTVTGALKCGNASAATKTYIALGTPINSGVVKISGTITVASSNGSWTFFQILNSEDKEFVGFRTASGGVWGYRTAGTGNPAATPIASNTSSEHTFEILIDFDNDKFTVKVDNTVLADNVDIANNANATQTDFGSIMINCNAGRYVNIGSVTSATQDA